MRSSVKLDNLCACSRSIPDQGVICWTCAERLRDLLLVLAGWVGDLEVTRTRQARLGDGGPRGKGSELPLMWNEAASALMKSLATDVRRWLIDLNEQVVLDDHLHDLLVAVAGLVGRIRLRDWAPRMLVRVENHGTRAEKVLDRPPSVTYMGPCPSCSADLYGVRAGEQVGCRKCLSAWDVTERVRWLHAQLDDQLVPAKPLAEYLGVTPDRVRMWASRGRILAHGRDRKGRPVYRVGDAVALLAARRRSA